MSRPAITALELAAAGADLAEELLDAEAIEAQLNAEMIRAYLAGYARAVEEVQALLEG